MGPVVEFATGVRLRWSFIHFARCGNFRIRPDLTNASRYRERPVLFEYDPEVGKGLVVDLHFFEYCILEIVSQQKLRELPHFQSCSWVAVKNQLVETLYVS